MNFRIKAVRKESGKTMEKFGASIGISAPAVSQLESGKTTPTKQTIAAICTTYKINEEWLLTGVGEMHSTLSKKEMISEFFADVLTDPDDSFRVRFIEALSKMTVEDWEYIGKMMERIVKKEEG